MRGPFCIHVPVREAFLHPDADTIGIYALSGLLWKIRISGVNAPERGSELYDVVNSFTADLLKKHKGDLSVQVTFSEKMLGKARREELNVLQFISHERVPGAIWLDPETLLAQVLLDKGYVERDERYPLV